MTLSVPHIYGKAAQLFMLIAWALLAAACGEDGGDMPVQTEKLYKAQFFLTVGNDIPSVSRATPGDGEYNHGDGFENYINLPDNDIRVTLLGADNSLICELKDFSITPLETLPGSKRYVINGSTKTDLSLVQNFKVMVLANWGNENYPDELTLENIRKIRYAYKGGQLGYDNLIPLFGITNVLSRSFEPGVAVNLGTIHLLRAMAKIEIIYSDSSGFWGIKTPTLTAHHDIGLCAPSSVETQNDYIANSWQLDYGKSFSVPSDAKVIEEPLEFIPDGTNRWMLYVPEFSNTVNIHNTAKIKIEFNDPILETQYIDFHDPSLASKPIIDLRRNYWYRITVSKKQVEPTVTIDVMPYGVIDLKPEYGM